MVNKIQNILNVNNILFIFLFTDDLTPRIAIIKPFMLKEEMIVENEQRESTDNVGTDIFDKELSSLSISDDAEDIFSR